MHESVEGRKILKPMYQFSFIAALGVSILFIINNYRALKLAQMRKGNQIPHKMQISYPFVSILLPAYMEAKIIERCIESLINIEYPKDSFEIIVIAGGSDKTYEKAKKYASSRIRVLKQKPLGKSQALNDGLKASKGEIIVTTDADCIFPKEWLINLISLFCIKKDVVAIGGRAEVLNNVNFITTYFKIYEEILLKQVQWPNRVLGGENSAFRKSTLKALGAFNEKITHTLQDHEIELRIRSQGLKVMYNPDSKVLREYPQTIIDFIKQQRRWSRGNFELLIDYKAFSFSKRRIASLFRVTYTLRPYLEPLLFILIGVISVFNNAFIYFEILAFCTLLIINTSKIVIASIYKKDQTLLKYLWIPLLFIPLNLIVHFLGLIDGLTQRKEKPTFETARYGA